MFSYPILLERARLLGNSANIFLEQMGRAFCLGQSSPSILEIVPRTKSEVLQGIKELAGKGITTGAKYGLTVSSPLKGTKQYGDDLVGKILWGICLGCRHKMKQMKGEGVSRKNTLH